MVIFYVVGLVLVGHISAQTSQQPEQVHLSITNNVTEMVVTWVTMDLTTDSIVEYNKKGGPLVLKATGSVDKFVDGSSAHRTMYMHRVKLTDLVPQQSYDYHCGGSGGWSPVFSFTVRPAGANWSPRLALFGDMGNKNARSVPFLQEETQQGHFDAILHVGDFAYDMDTDESKVGDEFMRQIEPIAAYVPYMTCVGNHEAGNNFSNYRFRFTMPLFDNNQNMYYSINIGPIHLISFSSEFYFFGDREGYDKVGEQFAWLEKDLKEASAPENRTLRPWIITMAHRPMYCSNNDRDDCSKHESIIRTGMGEDHKYALEDLFYQHGVDIELWAHEHSYERLFPVYKRQVCNSTREAPYTNPCAPVHIITGSAGCFEQHNYFKPFYGPWTAYRTVDYGYTRMQAFNGSHIYIEQFSTDKAAVVDKVWIIKEKHGYQ
ncbi:acid phosphatase type 7 [Exaiptasia diaphana]|uniref:Purple acid phosphatase n=1 Tax=Exaiptasia diaphana TaxID=2652724 RepID=A0A913Y0I3_EXADI|nr:acid phosphatase type 7 [Exaiptasia diaphana]